MKFWFWGSVLTGFYAYVGYPLLLVVLSRIRTRDVRRCAYTPPVSFIITAHNESAAIARKIANTLEQDYPPALFDIIVASDCSTDGTDQIAAGYSPRVRVVRSPERRGKEAAQHLAVLAASGDVLVFSDVSTLIGADAVSTIVENFADPEVGCVSSVDRFVDEHGLASGEGAYVRYEMLLRSLESRVNSLVGLSGSFFAARRCVCETWAHDRPSDFNTLLNAIDQRLRGVVDPRCAGHYRSITDRGREFDRKVRTVVRGLHAVFSNLRLLNPLRYGLFSWQLASHKLCRWLVPFAMLGAAVSGTALASESSTYFRLWLLQCGFYVTAVVGHATGTRWLRIPTYLCVVNLGVLHAWLRFAGGERFTTWTPSTRAASMSDAR